MATTSTINLTMSCLSTIFSGYGGGTRGYNLLAYTGIRFSDGSYGPTNPPISMSTFLGKSAYSGGGGGGTQTFITSGTFTVPSGVTSLTVELRGAKGTGGFSPGNGGLLSGTLTVTPTTVYNILINVGGGTASGGGRPGGGFAAITNSSETTYYAIAGGGGGSSGASNGGINNGGDGGGLTADAGANDVGGRGEGLGGGGGSQSSGGSGGNAGTSGTNLQGGNGDSGGAGGGGGGGYYGGGGGGYISSGSGGGGGGGGGSSYVGSLTGTVVNTVGGNTSVDTGNVVITWGGGGGGTYTLSYNPTTSHDFGSLEPFQSASVNVYTGVGQTFEVLLNGLSQSPPVYLDFDDSSSRQLTISGNNQFSVTGTTTVDCTNNTGITGVYTATATVSGTMTASPGGTLPYSYEVECSFSYSGGI